MRIRCGFRIAHECAQPVPMLLALSVHPSRQPDLLTQPVLSFDPALHRRFRQSVPSHGGA